MKTFTHGFGSTEITAQPDGGVRVAILHASQLLSLNIYSPDMAKSIGLALIDAAQEATP
ncbi:hypothetical protein [Nocardia sp. MH4]|uniref:hypothetical protein n=1 Tax=Nocardia sp. MH4 TaxID=1768677 RepID=UPI001C4EF5C0|nr:hypothetical protein [Nocardia sp. MH4]